MLGSFLELLTGKLGDLSADVKSGAEHSSRYPARDPPVTSQRPIAKD
jgi:hypothetical protein